MTFLAPALLWFIAAASVPIIIHLLNRRRHKTVQWAAMQFLLKATRESRGKKKLRHILILTCRALGIAALAFAAGRPIASGLLGWGGGSIDTVVLVLDRSASMELRSGDGQASRRDLVLQSVRDAMADIGNPRLVLLDSASGQAEEIPSPDVLPEISAAAATDTAADFPSLLNTATEYLANTPGRSELWLVSDLQASNWHPDDERWAAVRTSLAALPQAPGLRVLALSGSAAPNISLRLLGTRRTTDALMLDLELIRSEESRGSLALPLTTSLNGTRTTETINLAGQSLRFQKRVTIPPDSETGSGWLSIPPDGNPRDNAAFYAYGPALPTRSLLVSPAGEAAEYLALAAAPPGFENQSVERIDPAQFATRSLDEFSLILWAAPLPTGPSATTLERFISIGGNVICLPGSLPSTESFLGIEWAATQTADPGKFFILEDWNRTDGPLRDGIDGSPIPAERLRAIRRAVPQGNVAVLARWEDGEPFLTRRIIDRGTLWFLASTPDYTWSNLGDADVLLPIAQRTLALGAERFDASYLAEVGRENLPQNSGETRTRIEDFSKPDPANAAYEAGVFRIGERLVAINRPAEEDDVRVVTKDALDAMLDGTNYRLLNQDGQAADPNLSTDLWRAFLLAVIFFLIAEALLCLPKKSTENPIPGTLRKPA